MHLRAASATTASPSNTHNDSSPSASDVQHRHAAGPTFPSRCGQHQPTTLRPLPPSPPLLLLPPPLLLLPLLLLMLLWPLLLPLPMPQRRKGFQCAVVVDAEGVESGFAESDERDDRPPLVRRLSLSLSLSLRVRGCSSTGVVGRGSPSAILDVC